ncbi:MAG: sensor histidine kinase [Acidobacteriota bacterium]|nr:sensor histidine kinase [Acidobacteriota bacterium]MDE3192010.1 sensor histidine kinase [Acidobacteriota bacterium]
MTESGRGPTWGRLAGRRRALDALVALAALALGLGGLGLGGGHAHYRPTDALAVALAALTTAPLAWRRASPGWVLVVCGSGELANVLAGYRPGLAWAAVLFAVYSFAAERGERTEVWAILVWAAELGVMTAAAPHPNDPWYPGGLFAASAFAWLRGDWSRSRRREEERARSERALAAVADERARIARELHDVVAHALGVIVMQAGGAGALAELDQARARRVLSTIEHTGRQAFAEMRRLVGVLRDDPAGGTLAPPPSMAALPALVDEMNEAGLSVSLDVEGTPSAVGEGVQLSAYRIVQEALTNTLKHAGRTHAAVRVCWSEEALEVEVTDDGAVGEDELVRAVTAGSGGHGLVGMRERVALYGGAFEAAPTPSGGFRVRARLPLGSVR